ncbi:MAG: hypothetical protein ABI784_08110 [Ginsengibacter sp.]
MAQKKNVLIFLICCVFFSCSQPDRGRSSNVEQPGYKKYLIKAGTFENMNVLSTISVHMAFKTIIYFDDYGMKECRDTYSADSLEERFMCDGMNTYKIIPKEKTAYLVGKAYRGTEPRFSWDEVDKADKKSGTAKRLADTSIAGKECERYKVASENVTATFAGYRNISFLTMIISRGGTSLTRCVAIKIMDIPEEKFRIPEGYVVK